jgi:hypothetical protein
MATLVLSAAGAALGGGLGGSALGLTAAAVGKAVGASVGSVIDGRLLGGGAAAVETGRIDRIRVMSSSEGAVLPRCFGRMRVPGQLIWSSRFTEHASRQSVGGKATRGSQAVTHYGYSINLAIALCEGEVYRVGRIWADGQPLRQQTLTWRLHPGSDDQAPDPLIAAIEGLDRAPAYRGTAYVVLEELDLGTFGNRIPQFNFEVFRRPKVERIQIAPPPALDVRAVALVPGTGEYSLATVPVAVSRARGDAQIANVHNDTGRPDLVASLDQMEAELPACEAVSLVVTWFGSDLRANRCELYPAVEQREADGEELPWQVAGVPRASARMVQRIEERPLFGGTPADQSVIQAIRDMNRRRKAVMFYPFILMDILHGNSLVNPWNPAEVQPPVPWRGRITLSVAPGQVGSPDRSLSAAAEVATFFGSVQPHHFQVTDGRVVYSGPEEWSYRRFILHYAALCRAAGGVDAFCIGSEMRGLTQIRDGRSSYPAVQELRRLAVDVRALLGQDVKVGYEADWSEYFGHQPADGSGDAIFHLDPLWADPAISFVGIDNYMPLSDWRDEPGHLDADAGSIYNLNYLASNVAGGEGFDWFYPNDSARARQERVAISDGSHGEPWVFRYKDISSWWGNRHHNRVGGSRSAVPTAWLPRSKPVWFTEIGCPAVDKGTNQPNVFFDPKSSESFFPYFSRGGRDDLIQHRYLQATYRHWNDAANNPPSDRYDGRMVDMSRMFVWAWDARPWPDFPMRLDTWIDGTNYNRGHWLNGRINRPGLDAVIAELCERANLVDVAVGDVHAAATGYLVGEIETPRQSIQPLLLAHALEVCPGGDRLIFRTRGSQRRAEVKRESLVAKSTEERLEFVRDAPADAPGTVSFSFIRSDDDYHVGSVDASAPNQAEPSKSGTSLSVVMSLEEAQATAERWLNQTRVARESVTFALPPSRLGLTPGDLVSFEAASTDCFRVDRIEELGHRAATAVKVDLSAYDQPVLPAEAKPPKAIEALGPVHAELFELPLLPGSDADGGPYLAVSKKPWTGPVAVYASDFDGDYRLSHFVDRPAVVGTLMQPLPWARSGLWMRSSTLIRLDAGSLTSRSEEEVLRGANTVVLRHPSSSEIEVAQFVVAELVSPLTYRVSCWLRGQAGSDAFMPSVWPAGTTFLLLDAGVSRANSSDASKGALRHFRVGPAGAPYTDPSFRHHVIANAAHAMRPLSPVHLRAEQGVGGAYTITWIRRGRVNSDSWDGLDIPVGEEWLSFVVRVMKEERIVREVETPSLSFHYTREQQLSDQVGEAFGIHVAQASPSYGVGPFARMVIR